MDHYPEFAVSEREFQSSKSSTCSRHHSVSSSTDKSVRNSLEASVDGPAPQPQFSSKTSAPSDLDPHRTTSSRESNDIASNPALTIAEYTKYADAPSPYSEQQYEGKSSEEVSRMRKRDYAVEISRLMGRQLVKGLKPQGSRHGSIDTK